MKLWGKLQNWLTSTYPTRSGGRSKRKGTVEAFGEKGAIEMPVHEDGTLDFTLEEIASMTIRCTWCGEPIFIGEPITLYTPIDSFEIPDYAVRYSEDNDDTLRLIGCLSMECCDTGAEMAGFWMPDLEHPEKKQGKVERRATVFELLMANPDAVAIVNNDCQNPASKTIIIKE